MKFFDILSLAVILLSIASPAECDHQKRWRDHQKRGRLENETPWIAKWAFLYVPPPDPPHMCQWNHKEASPCEQIELAPNASIGGDWGEMRSEVFGFTYPDRLYYVTYTPGKKAEPIKHGVWVRIKKCHTVRCIPRNGAPYCMITKTSYGE
ncbi:hypothetical protein FBEOM_10089 [Fusarium beomiforme]|uniref:Uncharacterized protein n=1 Tax=Fusarium beomiforme TaxID=44412 RepID=A0A9P5ACX1_9HYPO|nr:hypothetical protein FBEOM_10089 [Fusarium beomiforme]